MYLASSLTFGILLLFIRASLAQSAPYIYQDSAEDEEALIDRLASIAAAVGGNRQQYARQGYAFPNYDVQQAGGYFGDAENDAEVLAKEYLAKLPRQFGYRPDDVRFYMPAEQFPNFSRDEINKADETPKFRNVKQNLEPVPLNNVEPNHEQIQHVDNNDELDNSHFMKKNQIQETEAAHAAKNIVASPSHIIASSHSVENPFHKLQPIDDDKSFSYSDLYYIGLIAGTGAAVVLAVVGAGIFWYRIHQRVKAAAEVDYPAYGVTGPSKDVSPSGGDRKLAQSAQMYHYQHQKQQMAALQKGAIPEDRTGAAGSEAESEDENEDDNDYTVYECPGLAPAGEMEVKNPLFDEVTPATPSQLKNEENK